jgi:tetrahydromethanopterin S-methyltransferase subunit G
MINERLDKIDKKLDEVIDNQHKLELKLTKRVDRNTLIINAMLWVVCAVVGAGIIASIPTLFALL